MPINYTTIREYIPILEKNEKLVRIKRPINKNTELHPLVRWQFIGLPDNERRAFLFENIIDSKGKQYDSPTLVGGLAASTEIYSLGMNCNPKDIPDKWIYASSNPIKPKLVESSPWEEVHIGNTLSEHEGLGEFPIPISTPGFDNAPYFTASSWITKDPDTGIRNVGNYRAQVKGKLKTATNAGFRTDLGRDWIKYQAKGVPQEAACCLGLPPYISYVSSQKFSHDVDELEVAGALKGEPVELTKCKTIDLEVPTSAEIILEGTISIDAMEPEGPFGESHGFMDPRHLRLVFDIKCIQHRINPIYVSIISQLTPSESGKIRGLGREALIYRHLHNECGISDVLRVGVLDVLVDPGQYIVIQMNKKDMFEPWRALHAAQSFREAMGKIIVAVDADIDPKDPFAVNWAICNRAQPHKDMQIADKKPIAHGPVKILMDGGVPNRYDKEDSALLIDATRKADFPPISLPAKEFMERARGIWEDEGLPKLNPRSPWYGYSLGYWPADCEEEARMAISGEHYETGDKMKKQEVRIKPDDSVTSIPDEWAARRRKEGE